MLRSPFLHLFTVALFRQRAKHIGAVLISVIIIFLLSAVLFLSHAIEHDLLLALKSRQDFTVTRLQAGREVNTPTVWAEEIMNLNGVTHLASRIYGRYYFTPKEKSFLVIGIDFFDEQSTEALSKLVEGLDLEHFLQRPNMIVGEGVAAFLHQHYFTDTFTFKTPSGAFKEVGIYATLPKQSNLIGNDMVILPIELAREIFGLGEDEVTDITFNVPNDAEWDNIETKLHLMFNDVEVIGKHQMQKAYEKLFNFKGGLFLVLYLITLVTFMLILYQRYSLVYSSERKEIGILRAVGWSINDVLRLKLYENMTVVLFSFTIGVVLAYIYVFMFNAPLLSRIFLGGANLPNHVIFTPVVDFGILGTLFLLYAIPFLAAVLIPAWKIAATSPKEAML